MSELSPFNSLLNLLTLLKSKPLASWTYEEICDVKNKRFALNLDGKHFNGKTTYKISAIFMVDWLLRNPQSFLLYMYLV